MSKINFQGARSKDFENIEGKDVYATASKFSEYLDFLKTNGHSNYRIESLSAVGPEMNLILPSNSHPTWCVCLDFNDYLGFSQHPLVKAAVIKGIEMYGTGFGASLAIGGHFVYHQQLAKKTARFYHRTNAILYPTGYTANSAMLQCILKNLINSVVPEIKRYLCKNFFYLVYFSIGSTVPLTIK